MKIVLIGPPGAGKGTQAEKLAVHWKIPRVTTGDLFRQAVQEKSPLGLQVQGFLEKGALVPDEVVLGLMEERMSKPDCKAGFILDGFPRNIPQAEAVEKMLAELAETIIPKTNNFIGAKDLKSHEFALIMMNDCAPPEDQKAFTDGMKAFEEGCQKK